MNAEEKRKRLTRRNFLKTATASAGTAALAGTGSKGAEAAQQSQFPKWNYEAEVIVLGVGGAGLASAIAARDLGADVLILEKASEAHAGGNTRVCMRVFGVRPT
jgi:3-oxosteroid 1-dehydrogenase